MNIGICDRPPGTAWRHVLHGSSPRPGWDAEDPFWVSLIGRHLSGSGRILGPGPDHREAFCICTAVFSVTTRKTKWRRLHHAPRSWPPHGAPNDPVTNGPKLGRPKVPRAGDPGDDRGGAPRLRSGWWSSALEDLLDDIKYLIDLLARRSPGGGGLKRTDMGTTHTGARSTAALRGPVD